MSNGHIMCPPPEVLVSCQASLGEGPVWVTAEQALYWVDIKGPLIWRYDWSTGGLHHFIPPFRVTCLAPRVQGGFVAGTDQGFAFIDPDASLYALWGDAEPDRPGNRFNDGKLDRAGRFWAGTMDDAEVERSGQLFRFDPDHSWSLQDKGYRVTNGPAFSPDGRTMYHSDSAAQLIYQFELNETGEARNRRIFASFGEGEGSPDGMTIDAAGDLWVAFWDGWCLRRFSPDGSCRETLQVPFQRPTSCAFAGPQLDRLVITSARTGLSENELATQPLAGALLITRPAVGGIGDVPFPG